VKEIKDKGYQKTQIEARKRMKQEEIIWSKENIKY
jgi:hypothetical protein